jgi:Cu+-exporting ATPase
MKLAIGVMGASGGHLTDEIRQRTYRLGEAIAEHDAILTATQRAFIEYDPKQTGLAAVQVAMKAAGYRVDTAAARFAVKGIMCASCVTKIERAVSATPGVLEASVRVGTEEAIVEYLPGVTDLAAVKAAVSSAGYQVGDAPPPVSPSAVDRESEAREREYRTLMRQWWFGAAVGTFTMIMSYPWLFPGLRELFPRESHRLWFMWAFMGAA